MTIYRGLSGVNRQIKQQYRGLSGVNRTIKEQYRGAGGMNRKVFQNKVYLYQEGAELVPWYAGTAYGSGSQAKNTGNLYMTVSGKDGDMGVRQYRTDLINLTGYRKLCIDWECTANNCKDDAYDGASFRVSNTLDGSNITAGFSTNSAFARKIDSIDISLSSSFYIYTAARAGIDSTYRPTTITIYDIWLE